MPSLYASYIKERENVDTLETEKGFATYYFLQDGCYIRDIYISPDYRGAKTASELAAQIAVIAKEKGCHKLYGTVVPSLKGSTHSAKVLLTNGFLLHSALQDFIVFSKDI